tara:strand:+ start:156 stop:320 length:165 start_codon:yes stop_codon:yes gene_type:complete
MTRKKVKPFPTCKHEETKNERSYVRRTELPMDGYKAVILVTCKRCNKQLETLGE